MGVQVETICTSSPLPDGIADHRSGVHAACSMSDAMPNPGLRRMLAAWQRPELFLGEVIRHSLAPAEDRNTEQASIRFAQAYLAAIFVTARSVWSFSWRLMVSKLVSGELTIS
jgi:hypothetical protein